MENPHSDRHLAEVVTAVELEKDIPELDAKERKNAYAIEATSGFLDLI